MHTTFTVGKKINQLPAFCEDVKIALKKVTTDLQDWLLCGLEPRCTRADDSKHLVAKSFGLELDRVSFATRQKSPHAAQQVLRMG